MMNKRILFAATALAMLAACGSAADPDEVLESIRATEQSQLQAIMSKDLRGAVRNYADGAVLVTPGAEPLTGGEAITEAFDSMLADPNLKIEITPGEGWVAESGELAVTTSTARYTATEPGSDRPAERTISNQTVWQKPTGKPWMIVSDYNVELPAEVPQVAAAD